MTSCLLNPSNRQNELVGVGSESTFTSVDKIHKGLRDLSNIDQKECITDQMERIGQAKIFSQNLLLSITEGRIDGDKGM